MKSTSRWSHLAAAVIALVLLGVWGRAPVSADVATPALGGLMFIENVGQFDPAVRFMARGAGASAWLTQEGLWFAVREPADAQAARDERDAARRVATAKVSFVGANPDPRLEPFDRLPTAVSYFVGNDPAKWRADVPAWRGVRYVDLYPGVDLEIVEQGGRWSWRLASRRAGLAAGEGKQAATLADVQLRVEGADLAMQDGLLRLSTPAGDLSLPLLQAAGDDGPQPAPRVSPDHVVKNPFVPTAATLGSAAPLGAGDLVYSTYLGAGDLDEISAIRVDGNGNIYVTGYTASALFPISALPYDGILGGTFDAFVTKLAPDGSAPIYSTFLGGGDDDYAFALDLDSSGNAYLTGVTWSANYPTTIGAYDTVFTGSGTNSDAFVTRLSASGASLVFSTFLGGDGADKGRGIAVDSSGSAYVTGETGITSAVSFPTTATAYDRTHNGGADVFVTKFEPFGGALGYSTLLGSNSTDIGYAIAVDAGGNAYVAGDTYWNLVENSNFPTTATAFDREHNGGSDGFVTKLNATGASLAYSTFLGSSSTDWVQALTVDGSGCAYAAGPTYWTDSLNPSNWPTTTGAFDTSHNGGALGIDLFVAKLHADGSALHYSTFLGSSEDEGDDSVGVAVDADGYVYVTGYTYWKHPSEPSDFPTTLSAYDWEHNGSQDAFLSKLLIDGSNLAYSTFWGGSGSDYANGVALGSGGNVYLAGATTSNDLPMLKPFQSTRGGGSDGFALKIHPSDTLSYYLDLSANHGTTTPADGWYEEGVTLTIQAEAPAAQSGERYVWGGWTGAGAGSYTGSDNPAGIVMDGAITEAAAWGHEYYLTVETSPAGAASIAGAGWYAAGGAATTGAAPARVLVGGETFVFRGWSVDGVNVAGNPIQVLMGGAHTAVARYTLLGSEPPQTLRALPAAGYAPSGVLQRFTAVYQDPDGWDDLHYAEFLINSAPVLTKTVAVRYDAQLNKMYIHDPVGDLWQPDGLTPGVAGTLASSYIVLNGAQSSVVTDTNTLTVTWALQFTYRESGCAYNLYLRAEDILGNGDGWNDHGDWVVNRKPDQLVSPGIINTSVASGVKMTFDPRYRDPDKWANLGQIYFAIANTPPTHELEAGGIFLKYDQVANKIYLADSNGTGWGRGVTPGTADVLENGAVKVTVLYTKPGAVDAWTRIMRWRLEFKSAFAGRRGVYMRAIDLFPEADGDTGWTWKGALTIQP